MARAKQTKESPSDLGQAWLLSKKSVSIEGIDLLPQENIFLRGNPLVVARGQAQAFYLNDAGRRVWILKKFLPGRNPDVQYIKAIQALIPQQVGFESGYQRRVLSQASVAAASSPSADFPPWVENTILMPLVQGSDWAYIADQVRAGKLSLTTDQRLWMCKSLSERIRTLEAHGLSHRDLSSTNIFVDTKSWAIHLIDWDSLYHHDLTLPRNTTFGTNGYVAPFVKVNGTENPATTWTVGADRFSTAVLNVEFLSVERSSPVTGDGGLLDQDEIYNLGGSGLDKIKGKLRRNFPQALGLFDRVMRASGFHECPSPEEWIALCEGVSAPSLKDVYDPQPDFLKFIQQLQVPPRPLIAAPKLSDIETPDLKASDFQAHQKPAPAAPRLADIEAIDAHSFDRQARAKTGPPLPGSTEVHDRSEQSGASSANDSGPAAPSLADVEDPFTGVK